MPTKRCKAKKGEKKVPPPSVPTGLGERIPWEFFAVEIDVDNVRNQTLAEEEAARKFEEGKFFFILREFTSSYSNYTLALNSATTAFTKAYDASLLFISKNEGRVAAVKALLNSLNSSTL